jgi:hypothetical protein
VGLACNRAGPLIVAIGSLFDCHCFLDDFATLRFWIVRGGITNDFNAGSYRNFLSFLDCHLLAHVDLRISVPRFNAQLDQVGAKSWRQQHPQYGLPALAAQSASPSRLLGALASPARYLSMLASSYLSVTEFASLQEVARGIGHGGIPERHSLRLMDLRLIYRMLGSLRITPAGMVRVARGS